ncbi:hypothetical protein ES703_91641 [subsurface metagenome]
MTPYQTGRLENAICYFAKEHKERSGRPLYQTFLYKYLAFLDFMTLEEIGKPSFGIVYRAMENGPVPIDLYNRRYNYETNLFVFVSLEEKKVIIVPKSEPDMDYFSEYEIEQMNALLDRFAKRGIKSKDICNASHSIKAWAKAWRREHNSMIDYADTFDDLSQKSENELLIEEERFLVYRGIESLCK